MRDNRRSVEVVTVLSVLLASGCGSGSGTETTATRAASGSASSTTAMRTATIMNTGSTNTQSYSVTITLNADGSVTPTALSPTLATQFFADLDKANPVSSLSVEFCAKSASFGSSTYVTYNGSKSPDLQCQSDSATGSALNADASAIAEALGLGGANHPITVP